MDFKPRVFIGSSSEGLSVAEIVARNVQDTAEPSMWKEVFAYGVSTYDNLISQIALYDYAVLIATSDDIATSRHKKTLSPRDNVLFEFGLFAGGLGRSRVFYMVEEGTKIPSDLSGITLSFFSKRGAPNFEKTVIDCAQKIKARIIDKEKTYDLGFLPSTALAYGYFANFVERTVERLLEDKKEKKVFHLLNNTSFVIKDIQFTVLIPDDLSNDMFKEVKAKRLKDGWEKLKVEPRDIRDYDFSIDVSRVENGLLHLVDIPFTLNALNLAVDLYSRKAHLGKDAKEQLLEYREIRNFKRTLEYQIQKSSITRGIVNIEIVDI